jgi:hypothetical protein
MASPAANRRPAADAADTILPLIVVKSVEGRVPYGLEGRVPYGLEGRVPYGLTWDIA